MLQYDRTYCRRTPASPLATSRGATSTCGDSVTQDARDAPPDVGLTPLLTSVTKGVAPSSDVIVTLGGCFRAQVRILP